MIHKATFGNFKCLGDVQLSGLKDLCVFVGPNGSGKTSILEGLHDISQLGTTKPSEFFVDNRSPEILKRRGSQTDDFIISVDGDWVRDSGSLQLQVEVDETASPDSSSSDSDPKFRLELEGFQNYDQHHPGDYSVAHESGMTKLGRAVDSAVLLRLNPEKLAAPSYSEREVPEVAHDGDGLATVLREMQTSHPNVFSDLIGRLSHVVPVVEGVRTKRAPVWKKITEEISVDGETIPRERSEKFMGEEVVFDMRGAEGIPAHAVSEGTLLVLGLLTVIMSEPRPRLVLLDDIEQSLHPKALGDLVETLRGLFEQFSDLQILATSHSPYLLDHLEGNEIWLTNLDDRGASVVRRLDEHGEYDEWKDEMTPGEFWTYVGEDWTTGDDA